VDPEDLVADIALEPVDGQDDPAGLGGDPPHTGPVGQRQGERFVGAIPEVSEVAWADRDAASSQLGVDLRDTAMLGMTEGADGGDHIEPELMVGQDDRAFLLGADGDAESGTIGVAAASDLEGETDQAIQGSDGAASLVSGPERRPARRAGAGRGGQLQDTRGSGSLSASRHRKIPGR